MLMLVLALVMLLGQPSRDFRSAETARIRRHLATVEAELRARDVSTLTPAQREARTKNLDVLHAYWTRGAFPVNTDFPGRRVPYFIDRYGTRCAMAYLIEQSGRGDLVHRIATTQNNAYVRDLQTDAELAAWLRENGLTAAEAAHIQPTYGSPSDDFAGTWDGTVTFGSGGTRLRYVLTNERSNDGWMLTFPERAGMQTEVVALEGDSLVLEATPAVDISGGAQAVTRLRAVLHYGGTTLTGTIELLYASGDVLRGRTTATLECPGHDSPETVVAFVRRFRLFKVRCMTEIGGGQAAAGEWSVHEVIYRDTVHWARYTRRTALLWDGRTGWILHGATERDSSAVGMFRARPTDTALTSPAVLEGMTTLGLRLPWEKTLLHDPNVPRFVPAALIAALHDTLDVPLAELLVATPRVTSDLELLVALAHLPVALDSMWRRGDGGMVYETVRSGYANARGAADYLLWSQSLALIAARDTPHDVLLTLATWHDRHAFSCPGRPSKGQVFPALKERALREGDTAVLAALARVKAPC